MFGGWFQQCKQCCCKRCLFLCYSSSFLEYLPPCLDSVTPLFCVRLKGLDAIEESLHRLVILKFRWFASAMKSLGYSNANVFPIRVTSEGLYEPHTENATSLSVTATGWGSTPNCIHIYIYIFMIISIISHTT